MIPGNENYPVLDWNILFHTQLLRLIFLHVTTRCAKRLRMFKGQSRPSESESEKYINKQICNIWMNSSWTHWSEGESEISWKECMDANQVTHTKRKRNIFAFARSVLALMVEFMWNLLLNFFKTIVISKMRITCINTAVVHNSDGFPVQDPDQCSDGLDQEHAGLHDYITLMGFSWSKINNIFHWKIWVFYIFLKFNVVAEPVAD